MGSTYTTRSTQPPKTNPKSVSILQAPTTANTWYTALNLSGSGYLHYMSMSNAQAIRVTIDGGTAQTLTVSEAYSSGGKFFPYQRIRFYASLKVEFQATTAAQANLHGRVYYSTI